MSTPLLILIAVPVAAVLWWIFFAGRSSDLETIARLSARRQQIGDGQ